MPGRWNDVSRVSAPAIEEDFKPDAIGWSGAEYTEV